MKKESLLAIAAFASAGAACAQSSVAIFGVVDTVLQFGRGTVSDKTQLTNSGNSPSRIGFRGVEDLGGGMAATFWLEAGLQPDNGAGAATNTNNQASGAAGAGLNGGQGLVFNRRTTLGLSGRLGEVRLGRDFVPQSWNVQLFDPFTNNGVGTSQVASPGIGVGILGVTAVRASNGIFYFTPRDLGGFYGQAMYYLGENNSGLPTSKDGNGSGFRLGFATGVFDVAVASGRTKYAAGDVVQSNIGGAWRFGESRLLGQISRDRAGALHGKGWVLGGQIGVGTGEVRVSYSRYETNAVGNPETNKLALGYVHNLSKRTAAYATYARLKNSGGATSALGGAVTERDTSSSGFDIGVRHNF